MLAAGRGQPTRGSTVSPQPDPRPFPLPSLAVAGIISPQETEQPLRHAGVLKENSMLQTRYSPETMPRTGEELRQALRQALDQAAPLDDLVQLIRDLTQYEMRYGMSSSSFFARFETGELGDDIDLIRWANKIDIYEETKYRRN